MCPQTVTPMDVDECEPARRRLWPILSRQILSHRLYPRVIDAVTDPKLAGKIIGMMLVAGRSALAAVFFRVRYGGAGTERRAVLYATSHVRERSCSILVWLARPPRAAAVRRGMLDRGRWLGYSTIH